MSTDNLNYKNGTDSTIITYDQVVQAADTIKNCSSTMKGIFDDFISTMNMVLQDDVFAGNASDSLSTKFTTLKNRFDSYTRTVERFSELISSAATSTEATEKGIQAAAEDLVS